MKKYFLLTRQLTSFWYWCTIVEIDYHANITWYYPYSIVLAVGGLDFEVQKMKIYMVLEEPHLTMAYLQRQGEICEIPKHLALWWQSL